MALPSEVRHENRASTNKYNPELQNSVWGSKRLHCVVP